MPAPARTRKVLEHAGKGWRGRGQVAGCTGQESGKAAATAGKTPGKTSDAAGKTPSQFADIAEMDSAPELAVGRRAGTQVARAAAPRTGASSCAAARVRPAGSPAEAVQSAVRGGVATAPAPSSEHSTLRVLALAAVSARRQQKGGTSPCVLPFSRQSASSSR